MILTTKKSDGYELLDSGEEMKLERFGDIVLARPDPQALWSKSLGGEAWKSAAGIFERSGKGGAWRGDVPKEWKLSFGGLSFLMHPTSFKHTGLFPEQLPNWEWAAERIRSAGRPVSVLNVFAYTGGATLACAKAGASVAHVDASKVAVAWARQNAALSGLAEKPIRWLVEDVLVFVKREVKRGSRYDAIIMDPPAFGHGPKDELWKIEEHLLPLLALCRELLSEQPLFVLLNGYASGYSSLSFAHNLAPWAKAFGGVVEHGELTLEESGPEKRLLPAGIFARWTV